MALDAELSMHDEIDLSSATPARSGGSTGYVSVLTVDSGKYLREIGGRYEAGGWHIGASLRIAIPSDVQVLLAEVRVPQLTLIQVSRARGTVNAGSYRSRYLLAGFRFTRTL